jgi:phosphoribosyl-ATP pyrophosphohydrolase/phosphoribosyl-AMP cyclohydrolase
MNNQEIAFKWDENGLVSAIIQDQSNGNVLMLGYVNKESWEQTLNTGVVTFYSRSRQKIWVKGETSGNYLHLSDWSVDCDGDTLLLQVSPEGPVCHTGSTTCFGPPVKDPYETLKQLQLVIDQRFKEPKEGSYIQSLIQKGIPKIAQKVGEEGVELVIEAMRDEPELFLSEAADLLFHYLILLRVKNSSLEDVLDVLEQRSR